MAQEYKVTKVSQDEPRKWDGPNGTIYYIKVMLEGHDRPVSIGKKRADGLKVGDTVFGEIESNTEYDTDKFKSQSQGGYTPGGKAPRDENAIRAQFAIKAAIQAYGFDRDALATPEDSFTQYENIKDVAIEFYNMVDKVKAGQTEAPAPTAAAPVPVKDTVITELPEGEVNLDEIPF